MQESFYYVNKNQLSFCLDYAFPCWFLILLFYQFSLIGSSLILIKNNHKQNVVN